MSNRPKYNAAYKYMLFSKINQVIYIFFKLLCKVYNVLIDNLQLMMATQN